MYEEAATAAAHHLLPTSALRAWTSSVVLRSVISLLRRRTSTAYAMASVGVVPSSSHVIELADACHHNAQVQGPTQKVLGTVSESVPKRGQQSLSGGGRSHHQRHRAGGSGLIKAKSVTGVIALFKNRKRNIAVRLSKLGASLDIHAPHRQLSLQPVFGTR